MLDVSRSLNAFEVKCGASATLLRSFIERYVIPAEATVMRLLFLHPPAIPRAAPNSSYSLSLHWHS